MATPKRTWFRGHAGVRDLIRDNDVLAFFWGLSERLRRETFERGRHEREVARGSRFTYSYLLHDTGKGTPSSAKRVAEKLEKRAQQLHDTPGSGWCFGPIRFAFGETEWVCEWPKWLELQERQSRQAPRKRPTGARDAAPEERRGDETKGEDANQLTADEEANQLTADEEEWGQMTSLWDARTKGAFGRLTDHLPKAREYFAREGRTPTGPELVAECIRRANRRRRTDA